MLDVKTKLLVLLYIEYQKDNGKPTNITPELLDVSKGVFILALTKLFNEGKVRSYFNATCMSDEGIIMTDDIIPTASAILQVEGWLLLDKTNIDSGPFKIRRAKEVFGL